MNLKLPFTAISLNFFDLVLVISLSMVVLSDSFNLYAGLFVEVGLLLLLTRYLPVSFPSLGCHAGMGGTTTVSSAIVAAVAKHWFQLPPCQPPLELL